ncbi:methyl-accepting chemotaxis protein [Magnetococcus sp. PR-3]|uniref:methyl-accepting chemotaxis protein n=1 Tax=Magnetococcus sp. PR-3 TaxID=3120355 RepID=UPI002FCE1AD8
MLAIVQKKVGLKILLAVGIIGTISLLGMGGFVIHTMERSLLEQHESSIRQLAEGAKRGLQTIMLAGNSNIAHDYKTNFKQVKGLKTFRILRTDRSLAFYRSREDLRDAAEEKADEDELEGEEREQFMAQATDYINKMGPQDEDKYEADVEIHLGAQGNATFASVIKQKDDHPQFIRETQENGENLITILSPLFNQPRCYQCHDPEERVRGVFQITTSLKEVEEKIADTKLTALMVLIGFIIAFLLLLGFMLRRTLTCPLNHIGGAIQVLADGDLTNRIDSNHEDQAHQDELDEIVNQVNHMTDNLTNTVDTIEVQSTTLNVCVAQLQYVQQVLRNDAEEAHNINQELAHDNEKMGEGLSEMQSSVSQASGRIEGISSDINQLTGEISSIAESAEIASQNVHTMAAAAEQMNANIEQVNSSLRQVDEEVGTVVHSISELSSNQDQIRGLCEDANEASTTAANQAKSTRDAMNNLTESAHEIGKVVDIINAIAGQTNMLALNASIEAAGAGEAGKGFAVVANEVKELAQQTADATKLISKRVEEIQGHTDQAVSISREVNNNIERITEVNASINGAVDSQSRSAGQINSAVGRVSESGAVVNRNAEELHQAAHEVARSAAEAATGTTDIATSSANLAQMAGNVSQQTDEANSFIQSVNEFAKQTQRVSGGDKMQRAFQLATYLRRSVEYLGKLTNTVYATSTALNASHQELQIAEKTFDTDCFKSSALDWVNMLGQVIEGRMMSDELTKKLTDNCDYFEWLETEAKEAFAGNEKFEALYQGSLEMRNLADLVLEALHRKDRDEALQRLDTFDSHRAQLFVIMDDFYLSL